MLLVTVVAEERRVGVVKSYWMLLGVGLKLTFSWQWEPLMDSALSRR